ncbi:helix-turn-helix domain-containing protein [Pseudonocardia kunmingensis]|uniref:helix-turn-helix domain-containing protein n=1 Tax=Pseudonocardia kunmingensis TaxID=630975 RepID=UPI001479389C|nr:helix-turn-helix domain-containing protein [Pseudonocardia kunmingensis]
MPYDAEEPTRIDRLEAIIEINRSLASTLDADALTHRILREAIRIIPAADAGVLLLYDTDRERLVVRHAIGFGPSIYKIELAPGESLTGRAFQERRSVLYRTQESLAPQQDLAPASHRLLAAAAGGIEYPHSALVAPLLTHDGPIGAMIVENFSTPQVFNQFDLRLFEGLAQGAAIAMVNARLFASERAARMRLETVNQLVSEQRDQLERRVQVQEALADIVREGLSADALVARLARLCRAGVFLCDSLRAVRIAQPPTDALTVGDIDDEHREVIGTAVHEAEATRSPQRADLGAGRVLLVAPIPGGSEILGFLCALFGDTAPDEVHAAAVSSAAHIAATELVEQRAREEGRIRTQADTLELLVQGVAPGGAQGPFLVAVGRLQHSSLQYRVQPAVDHRQLRALLACAQHELGDGDIGGRPLLAATVRDHHVVLVWAGPDDEENLRRRLRAATQRFALLDPAWQASFVVSDAVDTPTEFADALAESRLVAELHRQVRNANPVHTVRSLGAYRLILRSAKAADVLRMCEDALGAVLRYDRDRGTSMLPTLRAYLDHGGATKAAARALSVHPHTVQYRLGRLEELSGLRLSAPQDRLTLELCLRIHDSAALSDSLGRD